MGTIFDFSIITELFKGTTVIGLDWIIGTIIVIGSGLVITKDMKKLKEIIFPLSLQWNVVGLNLHPLLIIISGIIGFMSLGGGELTKNIITKTISAVEKANETKREKIDRERRKKIYDFNSKILEDKVRKLKEKQKKKEEKTSDLIKEGLKDIVKKDEKRRTESGKWTKGRTRMLGKFIKELKENNKYDEVNIIEEEEEE